jgi:hypothetical protein
MPRHRSLQMRLIAVEETTQHIDSWNVAFGRVGPCTDGRRYKQYQGGVSGPDGPVMQTTYHAE